MAHNHLPQDANPEAAEQAAAEARGAQLAEELQRRAADKDIKMTMLNGGEGEKGVVVPRAEADQIMWVESDLNTGLTETQRSHLKPEARTAYDNWLTARDTKAAREAEVTAGKTAMADDARDKVDQLFGGDQAPKPPEAPTKEAPAKPSADHRTVVKKPAAPHSVAPLPAKHGRSTRIGRPSPVKRGFDVVEDEPAKEPQGNGHELAPFGSGKPAPKVVQARRRPEQAPKPAPKPPEAKEPAPATPPPQAIPRKPKPVTNVAAEGTDPKTAGDIIANAFQGKSTEQAGSADTRQTDKHSRPDAETTQPVSKEVIQEAARPESRTTPEERDVMIADELFNSRRTGSELTETQRIAVELHTDRLLAARGIPADQIARKKNELYIQGLNQHAPEVAARFATMGPGNSLEDNNQIAAEVSRFFDDAGVPRGERQDAQLRLLREGRQILEARRGEAAPAPTPAEPEITPSSLEPLLPNKPKVRELGFAVAEAATSQDPRRLAEVGKQIDAYVRERGLQGDDAERARMELVDKGELLFVAAQQAEALADGEQGKFKAAQDAIIRGLKNQYPGETPDQLQERANMLLAESVVARKDAHDTEFTALAARAMTEPAGSEERKALMDQMNAVLARQESDLSGPQRAVRVAEALQTPRVTGETGADPANEALQSRTTELARRLADAKTAKEITDARQALKQHLLENDPNVPPDQVDFAANALEANYLQEANLADRANTGPDVFGARRELLDYIGRRGNLTPEQVTAEYNEQLDRARARGEATRASLLNDSPRTDPETAAKLQASHERRQGEQDHYRHGDHEAVVGTASEVAARLVQIDPETDAYEYGRTRGVLRDAIRRENPDLTERDVQNYEVAALADRALAHYNGSDVESQEARMRLHDFIAQDTDLTPQEVSRQFDYQLRVASARAQAAQNEAGYGREQAPASDRLTTVREELRQNGEDHNRLNYGEPGTAEGLANLLTTVDPSKNRAEYEDTVQAVRLAVAHQNPDMNQAEFNQTVDQIINNAQQAALLADRAYQYDERSAQASQARKQLMDFLRGNNPDLTDEQLNSIYSGAMYLADQRDKRRAWEAAQAASEGFEPGSGPGPDDGAGGGETPPPPGNARPRRRLSPVEQGTLEGEGNFDEFEAEFADDTEENGEEERRSSDLDSDGRYKNYDRLVKGMEKYNRKRADGKEMSVSDRMKLMRDLERYRNSGAASPEMAADADEAFGRIFDSLDKKDRDKYFEQYYGKLEKDVNPEGNFFKRAGKAIWHAPLTKEERAILKQRKERGIDANGNWKDEPLYEGLNQEPFVGGNDNLTVPLPEKMNKRVDKLLEDTAWVESMADVPADIRAQIAELRHELDVNRDEYETFNIFNPAKRKVPAGIGTQIRTLAQEANREVRARRAGRTPRAPAPQVRPGPQGPASRFRPGAPGAPVPGPRTPRPGPRR